MQPSKPLAPFISGLKNSLQRYNARQRDMYSWIAQTNTHYIFTAEIDHIEPENNVLKYNEGSFQKKVPPLSTKQGDASLTVSHAKELYDAVSDAFSKSSYTKLLLVKGTKYGKTKGGVKAVMDNDLWKVVSLSGSVNTGFEFIIKRTV